MKVRPLQSITAANETSTLSAKPTTETQGKNNRPASPPQSLLTTKTLAEQSEKTNGLTPSSSTTIQRPEVEVTIKPPNNIEFNPPISAENISTLIETGLSGSSAVDDISRSKEQAERQQLLHEAKIGQNNNNNKDLVNILTPFTTGFALWQLFIIYWIDMYNEFVTDAAKLTEYWFNAFVNPSTKREERTMKNKNRVTGNILPN